MTHPSLVFLIPFLSLFVAFTQSFAEKPASLTLKDRETQKQIELQRASGFSDNEIDTLHATISEHLRKMKKLQDLGVDKTAAQFLGQTPDQVKELFLKDSEGKQYLEFKLPQGQSYIDWPKVYLYDGLAFIYPNKDFTEIDRIVMMFRRVNADGTIFVKEMRRLINPTPKSQSAEKDEKGEFKIDPNSDILLEYYQALTSDTIWPNVPVQKATPAISMVLNNDKDPLPYDKQKHIMLTYKKMIRKISKFTGRKLRNMELDQKQLVTKITDFN
jgi:hypothetical protein